MENSAFKHRLTGAIILVILAVIFVPMLLDGESPTTITETNIPSKPDEFSSKVIPLDEITQPALPETSPSVSSAPAVQGPPAAAPVTVPAAAPAEPNKPQGKPQDSKPAAPGKPGGWVVQLGSFSSEQNAVALRDQLRAKGYTAFVEKTQSGAAPRYRVNAGP
ncbi:MAG: SPOR domain-containing protein [Gammaproteobacteria bacterium]|nr:SPOR domain-containing protein [Gammaproteobacteria bacterium]